MTTRMYSLLRSNSAVGIASLLLELVDILEPHAVLVLDWSLANDGRHELLSFPVFASLGVVGHKPLILVALVHPPGVRTAEITCVFALSEIDPQHEPFLVEPFDTPAAIILGISLLCK